jgi:2-polyprenyl-3-methyl-5-hydroxy-6-metoxy-1,4-benzoquinol methylase
MSYDDQTIRSRSSLKRWSHATRFQLACRLLAPCDGERILDYGTGDATLLRALHAAAPRASLVGFEPFMMEEAAANAPPGAKIVDSAAGLSGFDKVACLEVLEHLEASKLNTAVDNIVAAVRPGGLILISVPIEIGPSVVLKTVVRAAVHAPHANTTLANTISSAFGRTGQIVRRAEDGFIASHMGFDWRALRERLRRRGLHEIRLIFSPFGPLGPLLNSQVMLLLRPQAAGSAPRSVAGELLEERLA